MQQKDRKQMYRQQTMSYFINAALEIIEEEGIDSLSIRKTAEKAGYNSATLYHYFSDFEELRIFSAMKYLDQYAKDLPAYLEPVTRPLERYLKIWECFCLHSFSHPDIFWRYSLSMQIRTGIFPTIFTLIMIFFLKVGVKMLQITKICFHLLISQNVNFYH